eukprot:gnl/TRDRNA2_/TRDRNA2_196839_c0_seq1.p1 gnl/TRDRNA2_/TRDRNA2_196839_c0~~gnl/TRDRNA2_/TRDRNA2_196839_c0_seq1.p1  ORF type:complete len:655 (+),score=111.92 gnl/TRDRNA2_/TRDRNA2_196839_c0_seq1:50-2014(+)
MVQPLPTVVQPSNGAAHASARRSPDTPQSSARRSPDAQQTSARRSPDAPPASARLSPEAPARRTPEEQDQLAQRLVKSDELIKQLKHIVKAQHGKIEELRQRLETDPSLSEIDPALRVTLASEDQKDHAKVRDANADLRRRVNTLEAENGKLKTDNENLRKVIRRLRRMLSDPGVEAMTSTRMSFDPSSSFFEQGSTETDPGATQSSFASMGRLAKHGTDFYEESPPRQRGQLSKVSCTTSVTSSKYGGFKLSRLISSVPTLWRDVETPRAILNSLIDMGQRMLSDVPNVVLTVFMLDPWLRLVVPDASDGPAVLFYLQGKVTVQVFHGDKGGGSAQQPLFSEVSALPYRAKRSMCLAMTMPGTGRRLAVLQAVSNEEKQGEKKISHFGWDADAAASGSMPKVLKSTMTSISEKPKEDVNFTDSQLSCLQLVCHIAGGILEQRERLGQTHRLVDRMQSCTDVTVAVNKAKSLPDFEQRVKHMLSNFFGVSVVRVLLFNVETQELIISKAQMHRGSAMSIGIGRGVCGMCAKRQQVIHIANVSQHPYVDQIADGLHRPGKQIALDAAMLVGPLVLDSEEGHQLLGVVQLLERTRKATNATEDELGTDFSIEDQSIFGQLLQVCAHAAWRTLKVQELHARLEGRPTDMANLLGCGS